VTARIQEAAERFAAAHDATSGDAGDIAQRHFEIACEIAGAAKAGITLRELMVRIGDALNKARMDGEEAGTLAALAGMEAVAHMLIDEPTLLASLSADVRRRQN
jgi:hypothetical protein